jgi:tetratricopeptide (TPR) repeat protein
MVCSACGTESAGRYCPQCGNALAAAPCRACGSELPAGARYCIVCGEPTAARTAAGGGAAPWYVAGGAIVALILVILLQAFRPPASPPAFGSTAVPGAAVAGGGQGAGTGMQPPPLTGTLREQADQLFNRIMETYSAGDTARARFFLPMALTAYREAGVADADGLYHLSLLEIAAGDGAAALATAERILATTPEHLLGLAAAAQAARALDRTDTARALYERFLAAYDDERTRDRVEYREHGPMLPVYLEEARSFLGR